MKTVLYICHLSSVRIFDHFRRLHDKFKIIHVTNQDIYRQGVQEFITLKVDEIKSGRLKVDGLSSSNETGKLIATIIAQRTGLPAPDIHNLLSTQNKYFCRLLQASCVPEMVPPFYLIEDMQNKSSQEFQNFFPAIFKPVCGTLSFCVYPADSLVELLALARENKNKIMSCNFNYSQVLDLIDYKDASPSVFNKMMCEKSVQARHIVLDGYVHGNRTTFLGITEAFFVEGTISISHFDFPADVSKGVSKKIFESAEKLIATLGLNNIMFNIEYQVDEDENIFIIEINPRINLQLALQIGQVTGYNPVFADLEIAVGKSPIVCFAKSNLVEQSRSVVLRREQNALVTKVPSKQNIDDIEKRFPGVLIFPVVDQGHLLSEYRQGAYMYRYCLVNIPGDTIQEIEEKRIVIEQELHFEFEDVKGIERNENSR